MTPFLGRLSRCATHPRTSQAELVCRMQFVVETKDHQCVCFVHQLDSSASVPALLSDIEASLDQAVEVYDSKEHIRFV